MELLDRCDRELSPGLDIGPRMVRGEPLLFPQREEIVPNGWTHKAPLLFSGPDTWCDCDGHLGICCRSQQWSTACPAMVRGLPCRSTHAVSRSHRSGATLRDDCEDTRLRCGQNRFVPARAASEDAGHGTISVRRSGPGVLYCNAQIVRNTPSRVVQSNRSMEPRLR
jgi:hypothetical protein